MVDRSVGIGARLSDYVAEPECAIDQEFDELMDCFRKLKEATGTTAGVMGKVDPAVFLLRRRIIEAALKDLLHRSTVVRTLSMDLKKMVGKRLSNAVWKGYLLGLAWQERLGNAPQRSMVDSTYLWSVYQELTPLSAHGTVPPVALDSAVTKALTRIQSAEAQSLTGQLAAAGATSAVNHGTNDGAMLESAVGELAMKGFMIWKAQQRALGTE